MTDVLMALPPAHVALVQQAAAALAALGGPALDLREGGADTAVPGASLVGQWQDKPLDLPVLVRPALATSDVPGLQGGGRLLVTGHVPNKLGEALAAADQDYLDAAGNCHLRSSAGLVLVRGLPAVSVDAGAGFGPKVLRMVFALFARPDLLNASYRQLAAFAGVSVGLVHNALGKLEEQGWLIRDGERRQLRRGHELRNQWLGAVESGLRGKQLLGRYRAADAGWWQQEQAMGVLLEQGALLGGAPGTALLLAAAGIEADTTSATDGGAQDLWCPGDGEALAQALGLQPDPTGPVHLRQAFWTGDLRDRGVPVVDLVLLQADLLGRGDAPALALAAALDQRWPPLEEIG